MDGVDPSDVFNVIVAAEILNFQEIVNYLQSHLIENEAKWMEEHFSLIHNINFSMWWFDWTSKSLYGYSVKYPEKII